jgi:hypothetical protein
MHCFLSCPSRPSCLFRLSRLSCLSCLSCLLLLLLSAPAPAQQIVGGIVGGTVQAGGGQPPRDTRPVTGRSAIRGRVIAGDSGQPMRRATVRLTAPQTQGQRSASTDADGRYEFRDLPAGRYSVNVSKAAYVNWTYGQTQPNGPGKPIVLSDNQVADGIDVRLMRGAVITGRVVDEFGEPVPNANVTPVRQQYTSGQRRLTPVGAREQTNDIGEYRLFGLAPGQYYVSATAQALTIAMPTANGIEMSGERNGFAATFYPATADTASAQRLTVGMAQMLTGIDIALQPARFSSVSGFAIDGQGHALAAGGVSAILRGGGMPGLGGFGGAIRPDGTFTIPNLAPGEYMLRANVPRPPQAGPVSGPPAMSIAVVIVNGEDVSGVRLAPIPTVSLSGHVSFDDTAAAQSLKPSTIRVLSQPLNQEDLMFGFAGAGSNPVLRDDFTFEIKATPGRLGLRALVPGTGNTSNWMLKSIRVNGMDVTDTGIDVGTSGVSDVEIEMTDHLQQLSGTVKDTSGVAVKDYAVALFSQDRARWTTPMSRYFAVGRAGDDGGFKVNTLPPGEYFAIALDQIDSADWQDPDTLEGLTRQATAFVLTSGDTRTLELRMSAPQ